MPMALSELLLVAVHRRSSLASDRPIQKPQRRAPSDGLQTA